MAKTDMKAMSKDDNKNILRSKWKDHPIFQENNVKTQGYLKIARDDGFSPEMYQFLLSEIDKTLEKWALLYDIAMQSPRAFKIIREKYKTHELFAELEKSVENCCQGDLKCRYVEAEKIIKYGPKTYEMQGGDFEATISLISARAAIFIEKSVDKKLLKENQVKEANEKWNQEYPDSDKIVKENSEDVSINVSSQKKRKASDMDDQKKKSVSWSQQLEQTKTISKVGKGNKVKYNSKE